MSKGLPKGVLQIDSQEKKALSQGAGKSFRIRVLLSNRRNIEENLAAEEELVRQAAHGVLCLFFWRNEDCVVIGKNQDPEAECRMDAAENLGIRIARRRTGGGAVYQDTGNLNVSFIAPVDSLNEQICEGILLKALEKCGVKARKTGRNDLVIDDADPETSGEGGKFSGSASRMTPEGTFLFHATFMFAVNLDRMNAVLSVSPNKLARHRVASVRSRVTNLCEHYPDMKMEPLMRTIISETAAYCQM